MAPLPTEPMTAKEIEERKKRARNSYVGHLRDARINVAEALHVLGHYAREAAEIVELRSLVSRLAALEDATPPL